MVPCSAAASYSPTVFRSPRNLVNAECIFSDDLEIFYPSDLPNSAQKFCGRGKDFTDIFPGWFSAALTGSLSDFLLNSLHASHLLQQNGAGAIRL